MKWHVVSLMKEMLIVDSQCRMIGSSSKCRRILVKSCKDLDQDVWTFGKGGSQAPSQPPVAKIALELSVFLASLEPGQKRPRSSSINHKHESKAMIA